MVEALTNWKYEDRLKELGLTTLETRMIRADMIEVSLILKLSKVSAATTSSVKAFQSSHTLVQTHTFRHLV